MIQSKEHEHCEAGTREETAQTILELISKPLWIMLSNGFGPSATAVLRTEVMLASARGGFVFFTHVPGRKADSSSRLQGRAHVSLLWLFNVVSTSRIMLLMLQFRHQHVAMIVETTQ